MRPGAAGIAAALIALLPAAPASASIAGTTKVSRSLVSYEPALAAKDAPRGAYYRALPGEANDLTFFYAGGAVSMLLADPGSVMTAQDGCASLDEHNVQCATGPLVLARATLNDGDDRVRALGPADGTVIGGLYAFGGAGDDVLEGGPGRDVLDGGTGTDTLTGAGGIDTLSYGTRGVPITVDLEAGTAGAESEGEADVISGFENVTGGDADDVLTGRRGSTVLRGHGGDDVLTGNSVTQGEGSDTVYGDDGDDELIGGGDADRLIGGAGTDTFSCGGGEDTLVDVTRDEFVDPTCDRVEYTRLLSFAPYPVASSARRLTFTPLICLVGSCRGTLLIREREGAHRVLARGQLARTGALTRPRLTQAGQTQLRVPGRTRVWVLIRGRGKLPDIGYQLQL